MTKQILRVTATDSARALITTLRAKHGDLMFHQSGGCCDGSAPMCYPKGEFIIGDYDRLLGYIGGAPFYISGPQFEYWKHTQLIIDVVPGRGGMFSLDGAEGLRFLTRSRLFTETEWAKLPALENEAAPLVRAVLPKKSRRSQELFKPARPKRSLTPKPTTL